MKNKQYIDDKQLSSMDALHEYIKQGGKMEDYVKYEASEIASTEDVESAPVEKKPETAMSDINATASDGTFLESDSEITEIEAKLKKVLEPAEFESFKRKAQYHAYNKLLAYQILVNHYVNTGEFTDPEISQRMQELQEQSQQLQEQQLAESYPNELTQLLIKQAKAKVIG